jgi:hypothetical protein
VVVRYCTYKCDISRTLDDSTSPKNAAFKKYLEAWSGIAGGNLYIWNYLADFHTYLMPHPNISQIAPDVRLFAKNGAVGVFEQGDALCSIGTFAKLRHYLASHLLWNPNDDENRLIDEFLSGYYGSAAGPCLRKFIEFLDTSARKQGKVVKLNHNGMEFLTLEEQLKMGEIMDEAVSLAEKDNDIFAQRVKQERLSVDHAFLLEYDALRDLAKKSGVKWTRPSTRAEAVEKWIGEVKSLGVRAVRETTDPDNINKCFETLRKGGTKNPSTQSGAANEGAQT